MVSFCKVMTPAILAASVIRLLFVPVKLIWKLLINSLCGFACLGLLNTTAGITVYFDNLLINPGRDLCGCQLEYLFSGNDFVLVDMPPNCHKSQEQNESEKPFHGLSDLLGAELPVHNGHQNYR